MPPRGIIRKYAQLRKAIQIRVVLNLQMGAGDAHMEAISEFLSGQLYAVQCHAGRALADGVQVKIQVRLIELLQKLRHLLCGEGGRPQRMDIRVGRDHGRGMDLLGAVHENLQGMDLQVLRIIFTLETL